MNGERKPARVGLLPYLNSAPFFLHWPHLEEASEGRWAPAVFPPRQLGLAAAAGEVDAGLMALADLIRLEETFEPLVLESRIPPVSLGIANHDRVDSVLLFLRAAVLSGASDRTGGPGRTLTPEEAARLNGAFIGVTGQSSTSFRLLRLLLEVHFRVGPAHYERRDFSRAALPESLAGLDAALVIGDQALEWKHRPPDGFLLAMDLAGAWHEWTGLPFVFARWAVRRAVPAESKEWLARFLDDSLREAAGRADDLVRGLPERLGPKEELAAYLENFTYRLGPEELEAAALYRRLLSEHGIA